MFHIVNQMRDREMTRPHRRSSISLPFSFYSAFPIDIKCHGRPHRMSVKYSYHLWSLNMAS